MKHQLVIWDLDHTLYQDLVGWRKKSEILVVQGFRKISGLSDAEVPDSEIIELAIQSFRDTNFGVRDICRRFGLDEAEFHIAIHDELDAAQIITAQDIALRENLGLLLESGVTNAVLTHSTRRWVRRATDYLNITSTFHPALIFAGETIGFNSKARSIHPFDLVIRQARQVTGIHFSPSNIWVVEDSHQNLAHPFEAGFNTALVTWNQKSGHDIPHAKFTVQTPSQACDHILEL